MDQASAGPSCSTAKAGPPFQPPLFLQRCRFVADFLADHGVNSVIDAGCNDGQLMRFVLTTSRKENTIQCYIGVDGSLVELKNAVTYSVPRSLDTFELLKPCAVLVVQGDLTVPPPRRLAFDTTAAEVNALNKRPRCSSSDGDTSPYGVSSDDSDHCGPHLSRSAAAPSTPTKEAQECISFPPLMMSDILPSHCKNEGSVHDAVLTYAILAIEIIEHIPIRNVPDFIHNIFYVLPVRTNARFVILTTPNRDLNWWCSGSEDAHPDTFCRHPDHKFEMTARQFESLCTFVCSRYRVMWERYELIDSLGGGFTQGAVFHRRESREATLDETECDAPECEFPFDKMFDLGASDKSANCLTRDEIGTWQLYDAYKMPYCYSDSDDRVISSFLFTLPFKSLWDRLREASVNDAVVLAKWQRNLNSSDRSEESVVRIPISSLMTSSTFMQELETTLCALMIALRSQIISSDGEYTLPGATELDGCCSCALGTWRDFLSALCTELLQLLCVAFPECHGNMVQADHVPVAASLRDTIPHELMRKVLIGLYCAANLGYCQCHETDDGSSGVVVELWASSIAMQCGDDKAPLTHALVMCVEQEALTINVKLPAVADIIESLDSSDTDWRGED